MRAGVLVTGAGAGGDGGAGCRRINRNKQIPPQCGPEQEEVPRAGGC